MACRGLRKASGFSLLLIRPARCILTRRELPQGNPGTSSLHACRRDQIPVLGVVECRIFLRSAMPSKRLMAMLERDAHEQSLSFTQHILCGTCRVRMTMTSRKVCPASVSSSALDSMLGDAATGDSQVQVAASRCLFDPPPAELEPWQTWNCLVS